MALHVAKTYEELIDEAREAELGKNLEKATALYERAMKQEPLEEWPYNRLMIIYRKQKDFNRELETIEKGIKIFSEFYQKRIRKIHAGHRQAARLSNALIKSLGLKDKKGNPLFQPEPIAGWMKRGELVKKKLVKKR